MSRTESADARALHQLPDTFGYLPSLPRVAGEQ
jgi:hypothetical protein